MKPIGSAYLKTIESCPGLTCQVNIFVDTTPAASVQPDEEVVQQLMTMGFTRNACARACIATSNGGPEAASNWLMEHLDDANLNDDPMAATTAAAASKQPEVSEGALTMLLEMGLDADIVSFASFYSQLRLISLFAYYHR